MVILKIKTRTTLEENGNDNVFFIRGVAENSKLIGENEEVIVLYKKLSKEFFVLMPLFFHIIEVIYVDVDEETRELIDLHLAFNGERW